MYQSRIKFDHFLHVSIDSGHTSPAQSESVSEEVRAHFAPLISSALASGKPVAVPLVATDAFMTIREEDGAYHACLLASARGAFVPVVTFGVSLLPPEGALLWHKLNAESLLKRTSHAPAPVSPWIAARLEVAALSHFNIVATAGEFERSVAWTLATHIAEVRATSPGANQCHATATPEAAMVERRPVPPSDGLVFNCTTGTGPTLSIFLSSPSDEEIGDIRRGDARFALAGHEATSFILAKFGRLPWMDAPFHAGLYAAESRGMPEQWRPGVRLALAVEIVDRDTGLQRGARLLSLSAHFWEMLAKQVTRQAASSISRREHDSAVDAAYRLYPTAEAMLKRALVTSKAGD
ncbi:hypothetical protein GCT13_25190 [Paraburkholderia sp. CNPSo 3157]|uniref:Uncharacterized protein n=1 Tax=Paraburkholderia franconis TaxID=2654983 RepID=A0A7X1NDR1_9BURK|nr:hypothetical protein [Paraburkholderia franconis]MPW20094.1 hypothetical protein [Paraburkholderia franconis]